MIRAAIAIAMKDLRLVARDKVALFWVLGFPLFFAVLYGAVIDGMGGSSAAPLTIALVDEARTPASAVFVESLKNADRLAIASVDRARAVADVRHGAAIAMIALPQGFGGPGAAPIELGFDPARGVESSYLRAMLGESAMRFALASHPEFAPAVMVKAEPIGGASKTGGFALAFPAALLWGLIGCSATFAVAMVTERASGTLLRLRVSPIGRTTILAGKALACFMACTIDVALLFGVGRLGFGVRVDHALALVVALVSVATCFVGITMALSVLGKTVQSVTGAGWATMILFAMIGGAMIPLSAMPAWLGRFSDVSPVKWGIVALEGATWRALPLADVMRPSAILLAIGIASFAFGAIRLRRVDA
jgi:ABC-2 type transport system permease protein